jgi:hypothetical protein
MRSREIGDCFRKARHTLKMKSPELSVKRRSKFYLCDIHADVFEKRISEVHIFQIIDTDGKEYWFDLKLVRNRI